MKIIIASKNPVKINAVSIGFERMFPGELFTTEGISVISGVSDQPKNNIETFTGAATRAQNAKIAASNADFWVGLEGGIEEVNLEMEAYAWAVILDKKGLIGKGKTGTFFLPPAVAELIKQGKELGEADDIVFGKTNSKQDNGAIGILTNNIIDRTNYYSMAVICALIPFKNQNLYAKI